jgi:hypothetical protein
MMNRALVLEQFERLTMQLSVARAFLLHDDRERLADARAILDAVGKTVAEMIDVQIDPALGWRPGPRLDPPPGRFS